MSMRIKRSQKEIDAVMNEAQGLIDEGASKFMGLKYEDGIVAMMEWLITDDPECGPMDA